MSKGLKALEDLMKNYYEMCQDLGNNDDQYQRCNLTSERSIIEKELERLETLEEDFMSLTEANIELVQEQARNRKKLKALEIIKEKSVDVGELFGCIILEKQEYIKDGLEEFNRHLLIHNQITQEEYDLLKEVLKDE